MAARSLFLFLCALALLAQTPTPAPAETAESKQSPATDAKSESAEASEARKNTKAISLRELQEADKRMSNEREELAKRERRLKQLMEELKNQDTAITSKEATIRGILSSNATEGSEFKVPDKLIAHYESRDPVIAAKDFVLLYKEDPRVAMALIKNMKKKKSALLIDQISKNADGGKEIAAKIHDAIGTGGPRKDGT